MLKVQKIPEILKLLKFPDIFGKKSHSIFLQNTFSKKYVNFFGFSEIFFWKSSNKFTKFLKIPEAPKSTRPKIPSSLWHGINAMHETMDTGQAPVPGNHQLQ